GLKAQKDPDALAIAKKQLEAAGKTLTDDAIKQQAYNNAMAQYGTGSDFQKAAQAVTGLLQGLAGDNLAGALANASSPYLATLIKQQVGEDNKAANAMAHAVLGAVVAELNNQSAAAGGLGAGGGELSAHVILNTLFSGKKVSDLTESEKQQVSALSQLASGLAGGLTTGDMAGAITGSQAGKNAVENNYLHAKQITTWLNKYAEASSDKERAELVEIANSVDKEQQQKAFNTLISKKYLDKQKSELVTLLNSNSCNDDCKRIAQYSIEQLNPIIENYSELQRGNNIPRAAVATITLALPVLSKPLAPYVSRWMGSTTLTNRVTGAGISGLANLGMQGYNIYENPNTEFNFTSFGTSLVTGTITPGMGYWGTTTTNTIGAGFSSMIDGQSPWVSMGGAFVGSTVGYGGTKWITNTLDNKFNPWSRGFKERPFAVMPSITAPPSVSPMPGIIGNSLGSAGSEYLNKETSEILKKITTGNENESN
uniref:VENN motif pre-toxin domain-containing protein n=1 Tax=Proteus mirabilis TaxID=584 RepID=UPI0034D77054